MVHPNLRNGRPWDLDRLDGGLLVLHPSQGNEREGFHTGTADALWKQLPAIRTQNPDVVVVVSADAVYRMNYDDVVEAHLASAADRYGVVQVHDGRVVDYAYKPHHPTGSLIANEVFVFTTATLVSSLEKLATEAGSDGLDDFGDGLLPALVEAGAVNEYRHESYWLDVGTIEAFWQGHMDLLGNDPAVHVSSHQWPLCTQPSPYGPARMGHPRPGRRRSTGRRRRDPRIGRTIGHRQRRRGKTRRDRPRQRPATRSSHRPGRPRRDGGREQCPVLLPDSHSTSRSSYRGTAMRARTAARVAVREFTQGCCGPRSR